MMEISKSKIKNFQSWLTACGSEILPTTNEFELIRFRCNLGTGVIYEGKKGISISAPFVDEAYKCFINSSKWRGKGKTSRRIKGSKVKRQLVDRDGRECFFCGQEIANNNELTVEHLISVNAGGSNKFGNLVLAHEECNKMAGHKTLVEKIHLRDKLRLIK